MWVLGCGIWGNLNFYVESRPFKTYSLGWHLLISFEVCISEKASRASSTVKPCQTRIQLSSAEPSFRNWKTAARGVRKDQPAATSGVLLDDVIWWCFDFHCRNFMEFVWSKQFPHQLYLALQSHLKAWADSPKDLLHDITAHVRSGEVAQTCWVMGGADMAIKQLYFQWYVYNILVICLPHISIYYLLAAVPGIVVESVGSLRFLSLRRCWPSLVVRGLEKPHFWILS